MEPILLKNSYFNQFHLGFPFRGFLFIEGENYYLYDKSLFKSKFNNFKNKKNSLKLIKNKNDFFEILKNNAEWLIDKNISYEDYQFFKKKYPQIKPTTVFYNYPIKNRKNLEELYHHLEMGVIYSYSLIREGVSLKEIKHELRDYLLLKLEGEVSLKINVDFYNLKNKSIVLKNKDWVVYDLQVFHEYWVGAYFRTIFFGENMSPLFAIYKTGEKAIGELKNILEEKNILASVLKKNLLDFSRKYSNWQVVFWQTNSYPDFLELVDVSDFNLQEGSYWHFYINHKEHYFKLGDALYKSKNKVYFFDNFNNKLLKFPW